MTSLQERLLSIEDEFLTALSDGEDALSTFEQRWEKLQEDLDTAFRLGELDMPLSMLVHSTASRIATLADTSIELLIRKDTITNELVEEVESLMAQIDLAGTAALTSSTTLSSSPSHSKRCRDADESPVPSKRRRAASYGISCPDISGRSKSRRFHSEPCGSDGQTVVSSLRGESCARPPTTPPPNSQFSSPSRPSLSLRQVSQAARKRRRSDAGLCSDRGPRKKSHVGPRLHIGPRLHAVSDSFIPHMDPNTHPFFRRVIQADPPFSPQSPCPSSESASDQLPLSQGCTAPISDIQQEFDIDSLFALDPPPFIHLDDFLNALVDVNPETATTHTTTSGTIHPMPQRSSSEDLSLHLFNIPDSPLSSSSVSSPISTPSYPSTPRLDAIVTDSLCDDPTLQSLLYTDDALTPSKPFGLDDFPLLTVDDLPVLSYPAPLGTWGTTLCSTPLVRLPIISPSQAGYWGGSHTYTPPSDMLEVALSLLPTESQSGPLDSNIVMADRDMGLLEEASPMIPLAA